MRWSPAVFDIVQKQAGARRGRKIMPLALFSPPLSTVRNVIHRPGSANSTPISAEWRTFEPSQPRPEMLRELQALALVVRTAVAGGWGLLSALRAGRRGRRECEDGPKVSVYPRHAGESVEFC